MTEFRLSDRLARNILDCSGVALVLVGEDLRLIYANPAFHELLGYGPEDVAALTLDQLIASDDALLQLESGERHILRRDGSRIWAHAQTSAVESGHADGPTLLVQFVIIERQKQIETELLLNQSRMDFALEAAGQGVWDHDVVADTMYYSPGWRRMRGIPAEEPIDGSQAAWLSRVHPDDQEYLRNVVKRQDAGDHDFRILEYRERHRLGHYIWVQSRGRPVAWDAQGNSLRTLGTDTDITDRKRADEQYGRLSGRLALALDASRIGVWEADVRTGKVVWDERMYEIYGLPYHGGEVPETVWLDGLHPDDSGQAEIAFKEASAVRSAYAAQFRVIRPDGSIRHVRSRANPFVDAGGRLKYIGAEWDVTADVEQAEELNTARALAESRYAQVQLAQEHIQHAALHDYLTGLPNRRFLDDMLAERRMTTRSQGGAVALLHIDLDWFKAINDTLGHAAGDFMLKHVAEVLKANVRDGDFIARVGGDEFVVLCWFNGDEADLSVMADRIVRHLRAPVAYGDEVMQVGASVGIACEASDAVDPQRLQRDADAALYRAKNSGRNRFQFA